MAHRLLLDVTPNTYALVVVGGMVFTGLALGVIFDGILRRFGVDSQGGSR